MTLRNGKLLIPGLIACALLVQVLEPFPSVAVAAEAGGHAEEEVELAVLMGQMQYHSAKLGYAIAGKNPPLVQFYLHELEEVLEEVKTVDTYEGMPIGAPSGIILQPALEALDKAFHGSAHPAGEQNAEAAETAEAGHDGAEHAGDDHEEFVPKDYPVDWPATWKAYEKTIEACNSCHAATGFEFLVILPAAGEPPYNQRFEP